MSAEARNQLVEIAASVGPAPEGVDQITYIVASAPAKELTKAAKTAEPSYFQLENDLQNNDGRLLDYMRNNPVPEINLARDITNAQYKLSTPRRWMAVAACSIACFSGGAAMINAASESLDKTLAQDIPTYQPSNKPNIEGMAIGGGITGTAGGVMSYLAVNLALYGRLARRPAQKAVKKAEKAAAIASSI